MTIRDMLADGIEIECTVKVQSWDGDYELICPYVSI